MTDKDAIREAAEKVNNDIYDYRRSGGETSPDGIIGIIEQAVRAEVEREKEEDGQIPVHNYVGTVVGKIPLTKEATPDPLSAKLVRLAELTHPESTIALYRVRGKTSRYEKEGYYVDFHLKSGSWRKVGPKKDYEAAVDAALQEIKKGGS